MQSTRVHPILFISIAATAFGCSAAHDIGEEESPATLSEQDKDKDEKKTAETSDDDASAEEIEMKSEEGCTNVAWAQHVRDSRYNSRQPEVDKRHVGSWRGYPNTNSYWFQTDDLNLVINADGSGTFLVGPTESTLPEPRADKGYLCDEPEDPGCGPGDTFVEGYAYPIKGGRSSRERLQFDIPLAGPYEPWCKLQTPVDQGMEYDQDGNVAECLYAIYPAAFGGRTGPDGCFLLLDEDTEEEIDCGYMAMGNACDCYHDGCIADYGHVSVDIALFDDDDAMIGSIDGESVQFRRVE